MSLEKFCRISYAYDSRSIETETVHWTSFDFLINWKFYPIFSDTNSDHNLTFEFIWKLRVVLTPQHLTWSESPSDLAISILHRVENANFRLESTFMWILQALHAMFILAACGKREFGIRNSNRQLDFLICEYDIKTWIAVPNSSKTHLRATNVLF